MTVSIPAGWTFASMVELRASAGVVTDGDWIETRDQDPSGSVRLIQLADIGDGRFLSRSNRRMSLKRAQALGCTFLQKGDLLVARMPDPLGRACVFPGLDDAAVTVVDVCLFRAGHDGVDTRWLAHAINAPRVRVELDALANGTTRRRISGSALQAVKFPVPPIEIQRAIADQVDALLEVCTEVENHLDAALASISNYRTAAIWSAFRGELAAVSRVNSIDDQTQRPVTTDAYPSLTLPQGWKWGPLSAVAEISGGLAKGKKRRPGTKTVPTPYLRVANVQRGYLNLNDVKTIEATEEERAALSLQVGDLLFAEGGDRDKLGRGWVWQGQIDTCIHQNHVFRARLRDQDAIPELLSLFANHIGSSYFLEHATQSVNLASISLSVLKDLPVPIIPLEEQRIIWKALSAQLETIENIEQRCRVAQTELATFRPRILDSATLGNLDTNIDYRESASDMIDRLAQERASAPPPKPKSKPPNRKHSMDRTTASLEETMLEILQANADGVTPERLFSMLSLGEERVDDFFAAIKILAERSSLVQLDDKLRAPS